MRYNFKGTVQENESNWLERNDTTILNFKKAEYISRLIRKLLNRNRPNVNTIMVRKRFNKLESIAIENWCRSAVAAASCFPAEKVAPPLSGRNCMPVSPLPPVRTPSNWRPANRPWQSAPLRGCHLGLSPPRTAWTYTDWNELFMLCNCKEKPSP